jgi:hypothetical protein
VRAATGLCRSCRFPKLAEPDEKARRWVAAISDERLGDLLAAVSAMR